MKPAPGLASVAVMGLLFVPLEPRAWSGEAGPSGVGRDSSGCLVVTVREASTGAPMRNVLVGVPSCRCGDMTDRLGFARVRGLAEGLTEVWVMAKAYPRDVEAVRVRAGECETLSVSLPKIPGCRLVVAVRDSSTGAPVRYASVAVPSCRRGDLTDSLGIARLTGLVEGVLTVSVRAPGYHPHEQTARARAAACDTLRVRVSKVVPEGEYIEVRSERR